MLYDAQLPLSPSYNIGTSTATILPPSTIVPSTGPVNPPFVVTYKVVKSLNVRPNLADVGPAMAVELMLPATSVSTPPREIFTIWLPPPPCTAKASPKISSAKSSKLPTVFVTMV